MKDQVLVSVILPVRNGGLYIFPAVQSVLWQSFTKFELLLLDHGSADDTLERLHSISDPRLKIFSDGQAHGLACRLNQGIDLALGKYIARMDADDVAFPERLQRQVEYLETHSEIDLLGSRVIVFKGADEIIGLLPFAHDHEGICSQLWRGIPLPHPTWMGRAEWFRKYRYRSPEVLRAEDQELLLRASTNSRYACLNDILLGYRQGSFNFKKTLIARKALLTAQLGLFVKRRQWRNAFLALAVCLLKICIDLIAALPACDKAFFWRMSEQAPSDEAMELKSLLSNAGVLQ